MLPNLSRLSYQPPQGADVGTTELQIEDLVVDGVERVEGMIQPVPDNMRALGSQVYFDWIERINTEVQNIKLSPHRPHVAVFVGAGSGVLEIHALKLLYKRKGISFEKVLFIDVYVDQPSADSTVAQTMGALVYDPDVIYCWGNNAWEQATTYLTTTDTRETMMPPLSENVAFVGGVNAGFFLNRVDERNVLRSTEDDELNTMIAFWKALGKDSAQPKYKDSAQPKYKDSAQPKYVYCYHNPMAVPPYQRGSLPLGDVIKQLQLQLELNKQNREIPLVNNTPAKV